MWTRLKDNSLFTTRKHSSRTRTGRTVTSDWVANNDEQWPSRHEAECGQNDRRLWKHYRPLRSVIIILQFYPPGYAKMSIGSNITNTTQILTKGLELLWCLLTALGPCTEGGSCTGTPVYRQTRMKTLPSPLRWRTVTKADTHPFRFSADFLVVKAKAVALISTYRSGCSFP